MSVASTDFSDEWDAFERDGDIVVPEQAAIAVYLNQRDHVVVRQAGQYHPDEDVWVVIAPQHARAVAEAILRTAGEDPQALLALPAPERGSGAKDPTAAERQRRYRQRHRNGERDSAVTRNGPEDDLLSLGGTS